MDLGIAGRWAVVCASGHGPGRACADALAAEGANVVVHAGDRTVAERAAAEIASAHGVQARAVAADLATQGGRDRLLAAWPEPDILVTGNAWPGAGEVPEAAGDLAAALAMHNRERLFWAPAALMEAVVGGMRGRRFGRIVNVAAVAAGRRGTAAVVPAGCGAGMTTVIRGLAAQVAVDGVTVNQLMTGPARAGAVWLAGQEELGAACALLCSAQAGYISGVDLRLTDARESLQLV